MNLTSTKMTSPKTTLTTTSRFISLHDSAMDGSAHLFAGAGMKETDNIEDADIIIFNGGADIGTSIYGEQPIYGYIPGQPSKRDQAEIDIFNAFPGKMKVGICRGAQLLNCLNGGSLWQDVNNHGMSHRMIDVLTGEKILVTSTHHQMMRPSPMGKVIGIADESTRKDAEHDHYPFKSYTDDKADTEIVWYRNTRSLCIQGHPEYYPDSRFAHYCINLINKYFNEEF